MNFIPAPAPSVELKDEITDEAAVKLFVKRLDLIHPVISGNKWFKLKYNFEKAKEENYSTILTFGGAYSNHIAATAAAAKLAGFNSIGIIRGEKPAKINPVLEYSETQDMKLIFVSREEYNRKNTTDFIDKLKIKFDDPFIVPEGGANIQGVKGTMEILTESEKQFDYIFCGCGTATTLAGLILSCKYSHAKIKGISVLKGMFSLTENVDHFITKFDNPDYYKTWEIMHDYHLGGYAQTTPELNAFIDHLIKKHNLFVEPVYTGKVFFAVYDLIKKNYFEKNAKILVIHTGGFRNPD